jgi:methionyl-tRNA formyltransferase
MKIAFFGTNKLGVDSLKYLIKKGLGVELVVSIKTDDLWYKGVSEEAKRNHIDLYETNSGKDEKLYDILINKGISLIVLCNYPYVLKGKILGNSNLSIINAHASLLPKYRGRAPLNWAMINGESEVGLTVHFVDKTIDTGDIISQKKVKISKDDYIGDVLKKIEKIYPKTVYDAIIRIEKDDLELKKQDKGSYFGKRTPKDGEICLDWSGEKIIRYIKALSHPYPGAFLRINDLKIILWRGFIEKKSKQMDLGVIEKKQDHIKIKCMDSVIKIDEFEIIKES